jgi:hypothetical protein
MPKTTPESQVAASLIVPAPATPPRTISAAEAAAHWDSERRPHELLPIKFHIRGTVCYVPARTKSDVDEENKGPTTHVKTRTFEAEKKVWISPCSAKDPDARKLRIISDTEGTAEFGFGIPLLKLALKLPPTRQYEFIAEKRPVEGGGAVYEISFADFERVRREVDEVALAAAKQAKAQKAKARRAGRTQGTPGQAQ